MIMKQSQHHWSKRGQILETERIFLAVKEKFVDETKIADHILSFAIEQKFVIYMNTEGIIHVCVFTSFLQNKTQM